MTMRSGTKNCPVSILHNVETGRHPVNNTPVYSLEPWKELVWCMAEARRGREHAIDNTIVAQSYVRFSFDYLDAVGINELMVIEYEGTRYAIRSLTVGINDKKEIVAEGVATRAGTGTI